MPIIYDYEFRNLKNALKGVSCGVLFLCAVILVGAFSCHYSKQVDRAVEEYAESCECQTHIWENGVEVEDCLCPVQK